MPPGVNNHAIFWSYMIGNGFRPSFHPDKILVVVGVFFAVAVLAPAVPGDPGRAPVHPADAGKEVAMELLRYMAGNILKRPLRALFVVVAGLLSSLVLVFSFALGSHVTTHIREDTIAKWTGHLWVSPKTDFVFNDGGRGTLPPRSGGGPGLPGTDIPTRRHSFRGRPMGVEIQAGTAREYVSVHATDMQKDLPYRLHTELAEGRFPGPDEQYTVLITTSLAQKYRLKVGDSIVCFIPSAYGARNAMDFTITGIIRASAPWYENGIVDPGAGLHRDARAGGCIPLLQGVRERRSRDSRDGEGPRCAWPRISRSRGTATIRSSGSSSPWARRTSCSSASWP